MIPAGALEMMLALLWDAESIHRVCPAASMKRDSHFMGTEQTRGIIQAWRCDGSALGNALNLFAPKD